MSMIRFISILMLLIQLVACGGGDGEPPSEADVNLSPTASAGEDQTVHQQKLITLSGTGNDSDGTIATFSWKQTEGTSVSLSGDNTDIINFTSPALDIEETLVFELTVTDNEGASGVDTINIVVSKPQEITGIVLDYKTSLAIQNTTILASYFIDGVSTQLGEAQSSPDGSFIISHYQPVIGRISLTADTTAYAEQSIIVETSEDTMDVNANISLLPVNVTQSFDANLDTTINIDGQAAVSISKSSLVREDGEQIEGLVTGEVTVIDASTDTSVMPGDFLSIDSGNVVNQIESFGALNITFVDDSGNKVNLKEGESAQINIPISNAINPMTAPISMPLFYYDEDKGYWIEEGVSTLTELEEGIFSYVGEVGHFTTWNADQRYDRSFISGCFQDESGTPVLRTKINANGKDYIGSSFAWTDSNGEFQLVVKSQSTVTLSLLLDGSMVSFDIGSSGINEELILNACAVPEQPEPTGPFAAELYGSSFKVYFDQLGSIIYHFSDNNRGTVADVDGGEFDFTSTISPSGVLITTTEFFQDSYTLTSGDASSGTLAIHVEDFTGEGISDETGTITKVGDNVFTTEAIVAGDFRVTFGNLGSMSYHFSSGGICLAADDGDGDFYDCNWRISAGSLIVTAEDFEDTYTLTSGIPSSGSLDIHAVDDEEGIFDVTGTIELKR